MTNSSNISSSVPCEMVCNSLFQCISVVNFMRCVKLCKMKPVHRDESLIKDFVRSFVYSTDIGNSSEIKTLKDGPTACLLVPYSNIQTQTMYGDIGEEIPYKCIYTYKFCPSEEKSVDKKKIMCLETGEWSQPPLECIRTVWVNPTPLGKAVLIPLNCEFNHHWAISTTGKLDINQEMYMYLNGSGVSLNLTFHFNTQERNCTLIIQEERNSVKFNEQKLLLQNINQFMRMEIQTDRKGLWIYVRRLQVGCYKVPELLNMISEVKFMSTVKLIRINLSFK